MESLHAAERRLDESLTRLESRIEWAVDKIAALTAERRDLLTALHMTRDKAFRRMVSSGISRDVAADAVSDADAALLKVGAE